MARKTQSSPEDLVVEEALSQSETTESTLAPIETQTDAGSLQNDSQGHDDAVGGDAIEDDGVDAIDTNNAEIIDPIIEPIVSPPGPQANTCAMLCGHNKVCAGCWQTKHPTAIGRRGNVLILPNGFLVTDSDSSNDIVFVN